MATPVSRMLLSRNTKSLPLHLLRARLSGAPATTINIPAVMSRAQVDHQGSNLVKYLLGYQSTVGSAVNNEGFNIGLMLGQGFGEMGCVEACGKKAVIEDEDEDDSGGSCEDHDDDMHDDSDFDDDEEEEEEEEDWEDDDDDSKE